MKFGEKLNQLGLRLRFNLGILSAEWSPQQGDRLAAWKMYIELLTRITTQAMPNEVGNEKAALESIYSIFDSTRSVLKEQGPNCIEFSKIGIGVLNQVVRPFTTKWHNKGLAGVFECETECKNFSTELAKLQADLRKYIGALADLAGVEDLTDLEETEANCV